jgi:putative DNA primase/helicase
VESNRFSRADLEDRLLMVDDDMDFSTLPKTNYIKSIVTSECKMDLERKGVQSYQGQLYVRFLCCGNGTLTALHDRSDGFYRRQIILTTKDRPADRVDDPFLAEKLIAEKEGIFLWMIEGLRRLIANNYQFTISEKTKENVAAAVRDANNAVDFLSSEGYLYYKADCETSTKALYAAYKLWCDDNAENALSVKSFSTFLAQNADAYHLKATNNIYLSGGKRCRGYVGVQLLVRPAKI